MWFYKVFKLETEEGMHCKSSDATTKFRTHRNHIVVASYSPKMKKWWRSILLQKESKRADFSCHMPERISTQCIKLELINHMLISYGMNFSIHTLLCIQPSIYEVVCSVWAFSTPNPHQTSGWDSPDGLSFVSHTEKWDSISWQAVRRPSVLSLVILVIGLEFLSI